MNGIHDLGGMHGFGPVVREDDEPVFHAPWEGRVFAMAMLAPFGVRRLIETLPPADYLSAGYYERWLAALEIGFTSRQILTPGEIDTRADFYQTHADAPLPRHDDPAAAAQAALEMRQHEPLHQDVGIKPRFTLGASVRAQNIHPSGHTRLPRYVRGRRGTVARYHGVHAFPDAPQASEPAAPQPVYAVRFEARELWGDDGGERDAVYVDLWESYLEPA